MVVKRASVVFILCGQHHIKLISAQLRGLVRQNAVLVSSLADATREKLRAVFLTVPEQTLRSRIDVTKISSNKGNDLELACSQLCANKATGLREIYDAMISLGKKLGVPEVEKTARAFLFGHGSYVYFDNDQFQQYLQSKDALSRLLSRCEYGFRKDDESSDSGAVPVGLNS